MHAYGIEFDTTLLFSYETQFGAIMRRMCEVSVKQGPESRRLCLPLQVRQSVLGLSLLLASRWAGSIEQMRISIDPAHCNYDAVL
jgi:hypothetical protein